MAKVRPKSRTNPAAQDTRIERTIPFGPSTDAFFVSSVMWADAS